MAPFPTDAGALGALVAALGWALYELRAHRQHSQQLEEARVEIERAAARAQQVQAKALARLADAYADNGLEIETDLEAPEPPSGE